MATVLEYFDEKVTIDDSGTNAIRIFKVNMGVDTTNTLDVYNLDDIPKRRTFHPRIPSVVCKSVEIQREGATRQQFVVTCNYSRPDGGDTDPGNNADDEEIPKPWDQQPEIYFGQNVQQKVLSTAYAIQDLPADIQQKLYIEDIDRYSVLNSAFDPFDPPLQYDEGTLSISIQTNVRGRNFSTDIIETYSNTVNEKRTTVAGVTIEPDQGLMKPIQARLQYTEDGEYYYVVQYDIDVNRNEQYVEVLDQGFNAYFGGATLEYDPIKKSDVFDNVAEGEDADAPVDSPVKLDGTGKILTPQDSAGWYIKYLPYARTDWVGLPGVPPKFAKKDEDRPSLGP